MEDSIQLEWHDLTGPTSQRHSVVDVWALSATTTEARKREPQRVTTGAATFKQWRSRLLFCNRSWHSVLLRWRIKKIMAVASAILLPARSANCHDNQAKLPKAQRAVHTMIAASPSLFRARRFWASSTHRREAEGDSLLACAAKTKRRLAAGRTRPARTRPCTPSFSSTMIVVVSRVLREMLRYSDEKKH